MYTRKSGSITFYYYCSQWDKLDKKARKHSDSQKHRNRQPINHYTCNGYVKITIHENLISSDIEINHLLHPMRPDISIPSEVKQFILDNIDLLPREIYKLLVKCSLNINIHQKQIHFW